MVDIELMHFCLAWEHFVGLAVTIERITIGDKGDHGLDEIVAHSVFVHIERMNTNHFWLEIRDRSVSVTVNFYQQGRKIIALVEQEPV